MSKQQLIEILKKAGLTQKQIAEALKDVKEADGSVADAGANPDPAMGGLQRNELPDLESEDDDGLDREVTDIVGELVDNVGMLNDLAQELADAQVADVNAEDYENVDDLLKDPDEEERQAHVPQTEENGVESHDAQGQDPLHKGFNGDGKDTGAPEKSSEEEGVESHDAKGQDVLNKGFQGDGKDSGSPEKSSEAEEERKDLDLPADLRDCKPQDEPQNESEGAVVINMNTDPRPEAPSKTEEESDEKEIKLDDEPEATKEEEMPGEDSMDKPGAACSNASEEDEESNVKDCDKSDASEKE